jgi:hypothetical protein
MDIVVVEVDVMRVNRLIPFGHHRHCLCMTWVRESVSVVEHAAVFNLRQ